ncbi:MAG: pitrilysin family protein [Rikenellaceae bacterium]
MEFYTYTLPNGIKCIHRHTTSHVTHCALIIGSGTRDESIGEYGIAHFAEHGLFKGTKKRRAYHVNCRLENLGGEFNAYTTKEETTIHATTLKGDFAKAVELIADVAFNSQFPDHEIDRERKVIYDEINSYKDSPSELIFDEFEDLLFEGSELGHNILGVKKDIKKIGSKELIDFVKRAYTTDQMVFSSIGGVSAKRAEELAMRYFGSFESTSRAGDRILPKLTEPFNITRSKRTYQRHCIMGCRTFGFNDDRRVPLTLLINILGGANANSLLNVLVREKHGLTYNIEASYLPFSDCGVVTIYYSSENDCATKVEELIMQEIERLRTTLLTPRQLSMAKRQFIAQLTISMESNEGYMLGVGKGLLVHGCVDTIQQSHRRIEAITAEQIRDVAADVLQNLSILTYR